MKSRIFYTFLFAIILSAVKINASSWTQRADFGGAARWRAVGFSIGSKGYIGTGMTGTSIIGYCQDFWEYDPSTNVWTQKSNFGGTARYGAVGFSIGSKGYVGTGYDSSNTGHHYVNDFWEYDTTANVWNQKTNFPGAARYFAVGFSIGDKGYIGTGAQSFTYYNDFYEYSPLTNSWSQKDSMPGAARQCATGFSIGTKGYIGTGGANGSNDFNDFFEYDQTTDSWLAKANFLGAARRYCVGFSIGNKGYIGTGYHGVTTYQDFYEYDPSDNSWAQQTNFPNPIQNAAAFSICTKGYVGTGAYNGQTTRFFAEFTPTILPVAGFIASQSSICEGTCIDFSDTSTNAPISWNWSFPGGVPASSNTQNPTNICFGTSGVYTISLTSTGVGCSLIAYGSIAVHPFPPTPVISEGSNTLSCSDTGATYDWYLNGILQPQFTTQVITINSSQNGTWYVIVTSSFGCSSTSPSIQTSVGVDELSDIFISITPNPTSSVFTIRSTTQIQRASIEIYNCIGEKIFADVIIEKVKEINVNSFTKGIYFVKVSSGDKSMVQKLVIN